MRIFLWVIYLLLFVSIVHSKLGDGVTEQKLIDLQEAIPGINAEALIASKEITVTNIGGGGIRFTKGKEAMFVQLGHQSAEVTVLNGRLQVNDYFLDRGEFKIKSDGTSSVGRVGITSEIEEAFDTPGRPRLKMFVNGGADINRDTPCETADCIGYVGPNGETGNGKLYVHLTTSRFVGQKLSEGIAEMEFRGGGYAPEGFLPPDATIVGPNHKIEEIYQKLKMKVEVPGQKMKASLLIPKTVAGISIDTSAFRLAFSRDHFGTMISYGAGGDNKPVGVIRKLA